MRESENLVGVRKRYAPDQKRKIEMRSGSKEIEPPTIERKVGISRELRNKCKTCLL